MIALSYGSQWQTMGGPVCASVCAFGVAVRDFDDFVRHGLGERGSEKDQDGELNHHREPFPLCDDVESSKPPPYRKQDRLDGYGVPTNNRYFPRILTELLSEGRTKRWEHDRAPHSS